MGETIWQKASRIEKERFRVLNDRKTCEYVKQGDDFLKKHGIEFDCQLLGLQKYFPDDKEKRHVYEIVFSRKEKDFSIRFGQSIYCTELNIRPTAYDVLTCIQKNDPGRFDEFCSDFGYNEDSIKDRQLYFRVVEEWKKVSGFFSFEELEEMEEIQ